jgi:hypothetical protein
MKKFSQLNEITLPPTRKYNLKPEEREYPLTCKFKNRNPDPGICNIVSIDFDDGVAFVSNGRFRYRAEFKDFIPDIFVFSKYNL